uniref:Peptidase A2 domain-containing protein n=1 Tax=Chromera velia CCMP2878 TaxID=1169474 RepID=A0A0G4FGE0_9ALVE|eukprot:Cvel_16703.t1-p1 / transcript=Cvel_16703.t1 / gene=Cvel_16703 / organism=Chromera_velia_CCMP2878 / gene_product=hypothetical protein / transcript_product=hypothetical protein / location=Cvel_scaffold1297:15707-16396(-) / protein_length=175 / sequence_SO=supercontig / SO=protein_coding / is_pseudo=false
MVGNRHKTTGILDSGAEVSFIDVSLTLHVDSPVVPATLALSAAGGSGLKVLGETTISLSHPNNPEKKFLHTLLVTANTGYDLVLGQDFLKLKDPVVQYHYREDRLAVADLPVFHFPDQIVTVRAGVATIEVLNVSQQDLRLGVESLLTFAEPASRVASVTAVTAVTAKVTTSTPP